jgi:hypothetical protein
MGIALFTPSTRAATHAPRLVIAVEKESGFDINHHLIEFIDNVIAFSPMAVEQKGVGIGVKGLTHLLRGRSAWRAAKTSAISITSELALEPDPGGGDDARGLDCLHMISASLKGHRVVSN